MPVVEKHHMWSSLITGDVFWFHSETYLEARGPVEELHHMAYAGLRGLWEAWLKPLDYEENQHLPRQSRAILQGEED